MSNIKEARRRETEAIRIQIERNIVEERAKEKELQDRIQVQEKKLAQVVQDTIRKRNEYQEIEQKVKLLDNEYHKRIEIYNKKYAIQENLYAGKVSEISSLNLLSRELTITIDKLKQEHKEYCKLNETLASTIKDREDFFKQYEVTTQARFISELLTKQKECEESQKVLDKKMLEFKIAEKGYKEAQEKLQVDKKELANLRETTQHEIDKFLTLQKQVQMDRNEVQKAQEAQREKDIQQNLREAQLNKEAKRIASLIEIHKLNT